jgi:hypothetical protein
MYTQVLNDNFPKQNICLYANANVCKPIVMQNNSVNYWFGEIYEQIIGR